MSEIFEGPPSGGGSNWEVYDQNAFNISFTNPARILVITTNFGEAILTTFAGENESEWFRGFDFGYVIPAEATVLGIEVETWCRKTSNNDATLNGQIRLTLGSGVVNHINPDAGASAGNFALVNGWTYHTVGSGTDLWGQAPGYWTPATIVAASLGIAISASKATPITIGTNKFWVRWVQMTVTYSLPDGTVSTARSRWPRRVSRR